MIFVSIQGEQGGQESAENGKMLKNQQEKIDALLDFLSVNKINANEEFFGEFKKYFFCTLVHPKKDVYNRERLAMIWWDKKADEGELRSTLKLMGLSWEEFNQSRAKFKSKKRKKTLVKLAFVFLLCALTLIFVIKDK